MNLTLVTGPARPVVTLDEARDQLRLDVNDQDAVLARLIAAATAYFDGQAGTLGRALLTQTWRLSLSAFPAMDEAISLPLPPLQGVDSITYVDTGGLEQTLPGATYQVVVSSAPGAVAPSFGNSWPTARNQPDAVKVTFTAGYGADPASVPETVRHAILMMVGEWFRNRELPVTALSTVDDLIAPLRVTVA